MGRIPCGIPPPIEWSPRWRTVWNWTTNITNVSNVRKLDSSLAVNEAKFEFSEMYIFGKFEAFCRRLTKIIDLLETIETYSHLQDTKIEGNLVPYLLCCFIWLFLSVFSKGMAVMSYHRSRFIITLLCLL